MALDEPRDTDHVFEIDGFAYVVDKDLLEKAKPITVDFKVFGFQINSSLVFEPTESSACNACSTSSKCNTKG